MNTVRCSIPTASENINGIDFVRQEDNTLVAINVDDENAQIFAGIPGYEVDFGSITQGDMFAGEPEPVVIEIEPEPVVEQAPQEPADAEQEPAAEVVEPANEKPARKPFGRHKKT